MMQHTDWLSTINRPFMWLHFAADPLYSYLWWYETWNWEHKWRKYFMYIMFIPIDSMIFHGKMYKFECKILDFCDFLMMGSGFDVYRYRIHHTQLKTKNQPTVRHTDRQTNKLKQMKKFVIQWWFCSCYCSNSIQNMKYVISIPTIRAYEIYNLCCCQFKLLFSQEWDTWINQLANGLFHLCMYVFRMNRSKACSLHVSPKNCCGLNYIFH